MDIDSPPYTRCFQGLLFQTPFPSFSQRGRKLKVLSSRSDSVGVVSIERDVLSIRALFFYLVRRANGGTHKNAACGMNFRPVRLDAL